MKLENGTEHGGNGMSEMGKQRHQHKVRDQGQQAWIQGRSS